MIEVNDYTGYAGKPEKHAPCPAGGAHHWMIHQPNGETSTGICRKCGEPREFRNSFNCEDYATARTISVGNELYQAERAAKAQALHERIRELYQSGATTDEICEAVGRKIGTVNTALRGIRPAQRRTGVVL